MLPKPLRRGDTIGICSPSHIADPEKYKDYIAYIEALGYAVKTADNLYKSTYGYLASERERADDFNQLIADETVKMILFGGGDGGLEVLPLLDYEAIKQNPKILCSYSDGTSILNAVHSKTGLVTFYGQAPWLFPGRSAHDAAHFDAHVVNGPAQVFQKSGPWQTLRPGACEGKLIGGYPRNLALMLNTDYLVFDPWEKYVLFMEDHESISSVACLSMYISCLEQNAFMNQVTGVLFGQYADTPNPALTARLTRLGETFGIPVAYCDDFGHGDHYHGILPIGRMARLDATAQNLTFL